MFEILRYVGHIVISPVNQAIVLVLLLIFLCVIRHRWSKSIALVLLFHLLVFSSRPALFLTLKSLEDMQYPPVSAEPTDAVVVLTGGIAQYDPISKQIMWGGSSSRFLEGLRLFKESQSNFFVMSGATPGSSEHLEAEGPTMERFAKEIGIPQEQIIVEPRSMNTSQHPIELRSIFEKHNINTFYLVTSAYHLPRAQKVFEKQGFHPIVYPVQKIYPLASDFFDLSYYSYQELALHEWLGLLVYAMTGLI